MTEKLNIGGVIFDMDGLMLDTEPIAQVAWQRAFAEMGFAVDEATYLRVVGRALPDVRRIFCEALGPGFDFERAHALRQRYFRDYVVGHGIPIKPGLHDLLDWLDARGVAKAVASSTGREGVLSRLALTGLRERFPVLVGGDEVARSKPAPDIFLLAAERLGVAPERCVVLEDSESGIRAAHAAGMIPVMIPDLKLPTSEIRAFAHCVLDSLTEVLALLA